jgi:hypothetical protein
MMLKLVDPYGIHRTGSAASEVPGMPAIACMAGFSSPKFALV